MLLSVFCSLHGTCLVLKLLKVAQPEDRQNPGVAVTALLTPLSLNHKSIPSPLSGAAFYFGEVEGERKCRESLLSCSELPAANRRLPLLPVRQPSLALCW